MLAALAAYQRGFAGPQGADLLRDEGQLVAGRAAGVRRRPAAASTSSRAANSSGCWPPAATRRKIIFSGVGKTRAEMRRALEAGIGCFNVESEAELEVLERGRAARWARRAPVSIRVNPERRPQDPSLHLHRPQGQQVRRRARTRAARLPARRVAAGPAGGRHRLPHRLADHRRQRPTSTRMDRVLDLVEADRGGRHPAAPHRLRRRPGHRLQRRAAARGRRACGAAAGASSTRAASATASS